MAVLNWDITKNWTRKSQNQQDMEPRSVRAISHLWTAKTNTTSSTITQWKQDRRRYELRGVLNRETKTENQTEKVTESMSVRGISRLQTDTTGNTNSLKTRGNEEPTYECSEPRLNHKPNQKRQKPRTQNIKPRTVWDIFTYRPKQTLLKKTPQNETGMTYVCG